MAILRLPESNLSGNSARTLVREIAPRLGYKDTDEREVTSYNKSRPVPFGVGG